MNKIHTIALFLVLTSKTIFAQTNSIKGKVSSPLNEGIQFVNISLKGSSKGTLTNEDGEFILKNITPGKQTIIAQFVGLATQELVIDVIDNTVNPVHIIMQVHNRALDEVKIVGVQSANDKTVSIGKVAIKPMDLPQAVATIDRIVLERQQVLRMSDVLMNTNGVYVIGNTGGYQEEIAGRGFAFGSSNTFKNGVRYFNGVLPELSSLEKVEIMKGSAAILFGNVAAGGILNLVTKKPKFESGGSVSFRTGSYGFVKPTLDVYGSVLGSTKLAYRLNATTENGNSFRENVSANRQYINPSLLYQLNSKTSILIETSYQKDHRTADFGIGSINYAISNLPRERFIGVAWSYFNIVQNDINLSINHQINQQWKVAFAATYSQYKSELFANLRPNSINLISANGKWTRGIQRSEVAQAYGLAQIDLTGGFNTGRIAHQILIGADAEQYHTQTTAYSPLIKYDSTQIFEPNLYPSRKDMPVLSINTITQAPVNRAGLYVQDLVNVTPQIKLLAGIRYSRQLTGSNVETFKKDPKTGLVSSTMVQNSNIDGAFTPRIGLVYQPNKNTTIFGSYANSFTLNTGVDIEGNALPPSYINQNEIGIKNELFGGILSANATIYQIVNSNLAQTSLENGNSNTNIKELAGQVSSQGIEIDLKSKPFLGFSIIAGYSYNQTKYTKSNIYIIGSLLRYNPNHTANTSIYYTFSDKKLNGLNMGITAFYFGQRMAGRSTRLTVQNDVFKLIPLNAFTQIDLNVGYNFSRFSVRAKVANVFNVLSYNVHDDNSVNPIAPRILSTTITYRW